MKLKTRRRPGYFTTEVTRRRLSMPQFASTLPGEHAADAIHRRCNVFKLMKRINKMPRLRMNGITLQQIAGDTVD